MSKKDILKKRRELFNRKEHEERLKLTAELEAAGAREPFTPFPKKEREERKKLIEFIVENADNEEWIYHYIKYPTTEMYVAELGKTVYITDWATELAFFGTEELRDMAKDLCFRRKVLKLNEVI